MKNIKIADRTLCADSLNFSFKEKIEIARQLQKLCVDTVELPAIENIKTDTLLIKTIASFVKDSVLSVSVGFTAEALQNAVNSLVTASHPRLRIEVPVSTVGMEYTCHKKAPKMLETAASLTEEAKKACNDVEFCAVDATRAEDGFLKEIICTAIEKGANIITVCDNAAEMMPDDFGDFIKGVSEYIPEGITLAVCTDNKNGLAAANAVSAIKNGATALKTAVSSNETDLQTIGNIIKNCGAVNGFDGNIKYTEMNRIINQINWVIQNAQNEKSVVTVADAEQNEIELNKNDSKDTVMETVKQLGYDLSDDDADKVYEEFLRVADKKAVGSKELDAIVASVALQVPPTYKLKSYVINSGNIISTTAQITLEKDGTEHQGISIGDGPIDAAFVAIEHIIGYRYELDDFQIQSVTEGKQALGSALVKLRFGGKLYSGNGISTDILGASVKAYINAVNKIVYEEA